MCAVQQLAKRQRLSGGGLCASRVAKRTADSMQGGAGHQVVRYQERTLRCALYWRYWWWCCMCGCGHACMYVYRMHLFLCFTYIHTYGMYIHPTSIHSSKLHMHLLILTIRAQCLRKVHIHPSAYRIILAILAI